jgi:hypothetical protein
MVRQIHLTELLPFDKERLGERPSVEDVAEVLDEDCDVYLPDGTLGVAFRKNVFGNSYGIEPGNDDYAYWKWACRSLLSDQRGLASGKEIYTNVEIRCTHGQNEFVRLALKGAVENLEQALKIVNSDPRPSRTTYYVGKAEKAGLVDLEEVERWDSLVRKKSTSFELRQEAIANRNRAKLAWFENWLRRDWDTAEDRIAVTKEFKKHFVTNQPRSNKTYSAVLGIIDRSGRTPFGRLTSPTLEKFEDFSGFKSFYKDVDALVKENFPKEYKLLKSRFKKVKDERYNLFGTIYTSITCNYNFPTFYHLDGNNAQNAVATLVTFDRGNYTGMEFVMPQLGVAFRMRHGDVLIGDNQGLVHGQTEFIPSDSDAENLTLVFYSRDSVILLDDLECETCRRSFMDWVVANHPERGTGEAKWAGSFPGMWNSPEWVEYRKLQNMEHCSETNIKGKQDTFNHG